MPISVGARFKHAWNAFRNNTQTVENSNGYGGYYHRPDRIRLSRGNERTIINSIFNRIALDVAGIKLSHCEIDEDDRFVKNIDSNLNECLTLKANKDQTAMAFIQDVVMSMFDEGCIAIVPVDTMENPDGKDGIDILSLRVGKIITWYPDQVKLEVYDDNVGIKKEIVLNKSNVAIIENPFYSIMNEPNSTLQRLNRKLNLLDSIDEQNSSGKLDLIIQLPYIVKSDARKAQAEQRRKDIETQLTGSKYGIAYTDGTEKITQLNRPVENNLLSQIEYLTSTLLSQLGMTQGILDGTADDKTMLNYYSRIIDPILSAIVDSMKIKFLSKTARTQHKTIKYFRDPFKLVPVNDLAEIADKFTRNEILTSNEVRQVVGIKPSDDPKANMLMNSNINQSKQMENTYLNPRNQTEDKTINNKKEGENQNG